jgi:hypothetical protein
MDTPNEGLHLVPGGERREWDRLPLSIPLFVHGSKSNGERVLEFAGALDVSAGGALLATERYVEPNTQVSLEVPTGLYHKAQLPRSVSLINAKVLRCTPQRNYFLLGVQFRRPLIAPSSASENDLSAANPLEEPSPE